MDDDIIKEVVSHMAPLIQMYGIYVVFHGHLRPGGGFSGGMVLALSMALFILVFGMREGLSMLQTSEHVLPEHGPLRRRFRGIGILMDLTARIPLALIIGMFVILLKMASFFMPHLVKIPLGTPGELFSSGLIFVISVGVGLFVASTVLTLFILLVEEGHYGRTPHR